MSSKLPAPVSRLKAPSKLPSMSGNAVGTSSVNKRLASEGSQHEPPAKKTRGNYSHHKTLTFSSLVK